MSPFFTFVLVTLGVLAVLGIVVGVTNDAVNFLNSAIGSKAAPRNVILAIAAAGIMTGVATSNGMMEIARSGVFYPSQFTFTEIMTLFLGMMLGNIILLDIFNSLGLPTSTTVSLVFGLLGSAMAVAVFKIARTEEYALSDLAEFINSGKAMVIISAILVSVVAAFTVGLVVMYLSRLLFSFRYRKMFDRFGAVWCGVSFAGIVYFAVFKGLDGSGLIPEELLEYVNAHLALCLLVLWAAGALLLQFLKTFKVDILKITILAGTFSLALAFAGNDLVNFIGVPLAGLDSYRLALASGNEQMTMGALMNPVRADLRVMLAAGAVMVLTLVFSRKAMAVTETELSLSNSNEDGEERFGSSFVSRGLVRGAIALNNIVRAVLPQSWRNAINRRFEPLPREEQSTATYDLIRATVNLTCASILIAVATSFKLPLSTTYVVFMVAMGSSLADRAWGRESAVYRITGVMTVITGWFVTALAGFLISLVVTLVLVWGGWIAAVVAVVLCSFLVVKSNFTGRKKEKEEDAAVRLDGMDATDIRLECIDAVCRTMERVTQIYSRTIMAVFREDRKVLRDMVKESEELFQEGRERKYKVLPALRTLREHDIATSQFYVQVVDYISEASKSLLHITRPAFDHINDNHKGFTEEQITDLDAVNDEVETIFVTVNEMLRRKHFTDISIILEMRDHLFDTIDAVMRNQLRRMKQGEFSTSASILFFNILNETKTMVLQSRNIMKSFEKFIDESGGYPLLAQAIASRAEMLEEMSMPSDTE